MADKETTSFMRSLCMGRVEQDVIFPFPTVSAAEKETLGDISGALEGLLGPRAEDFFKWDEAGEMPADFIEELKEFGMFGLVIPEENGAWDSATWPTPVPSKRSPSTTPRSR